MSFQHRGFAGRAVQPAIQEGSREVLDERGSPSRTDGEYRDRFEDPFVRALKRWYKIWLLIGWGWPVAAMMTIYLVSGPPVVLASLLVFLLVSFGVFLPVLRLRVCPSCKANQLGICPSFSSR